MRQAAASGCRPAWASGWAIRPAPPLSFPRRRESISPAAWNGATPPRHMDSRLRGSDGGEGWGAYPPTPSPRRELLPAIRPHLIPPIQLRCCAHIPFLLLTAPWPGKSVARDGRRLRRSPAAVRGRKRPPCGSRAPVATKRFYERIKPLVIPLPIPHIHRTAPGALAMVRLRDASCSRC